MRPITAIYVNTNPVRWIYKTFPRPGNMLAFETTNNRHEAFDFGGEQNARDMLARFHNPHNRLFYIERINVLQPDQL